IFLEKIGEVFGVDTVGNNFNRKFRKSLFQFVERKIYGNKDFFLQTNCKLFEAVNCHPIYCGLKKIWNIIH
ncbi:MAG: hypothetical protein PVG90_03080, partial [Bacillota bacterium]